MHDGHCAQALHVAAAVGGVGDNEEDNECMMVIELKKK